MLTLSCLRADLTNGTYLGVWEFSYYHRSTLNETFKGVPSVVYCRDIRLSSFKRLPEKFELRMVGDYSVMIFGRVGSTYVFMGRFGVLDGSLLYGGRATYYQCIDENRYVRDMLLMCHRQHVWGIDSRGHGTLLYTMQECPRGCASLMHVDGCFIWDQYSVHYRGAPVWRVGVTNIFEPL